MNKNYIFFNWRYKIGALYSITFGLNEIHNKNMVHCDFHTGNILIKKSFSEISVGDTHISDMGLCGEVGNTDKTKIYGVMPYVAPEVLRGEPYTQAADIYSFGMIMYFVATGKQPFANHVHDQYLALNICNDIRPEINEPEVPKCYIDLMKRCWDSNPENRPKGSEIFDLISSFYSLSQFGFKLITSIESEQEIQKQFIESEEYRKSHLSSFEKNIQLTSHPQAIYRSRLLNSFTKGGDENMYCMDSYVCMYGSQCMVYSILFIHTYFFSKLYN